MWYMHTHACIYHVCMHVYAWNVSKTDFNTKILLSSWIMHRFQRFLMFWKAECFLFHLKTTFPHCLVFVRSKTWYLWKVCLNNWTNTGSWCYVPSWSSREILPKCIKMLHDGLARALFFDFRVVSSPRTLGGEFGWNRELFAASAYILPVPTHLPPQAEIF